MKSLFFVFLLLVQLAAEPMSEAQILARIEANKDSAQGGEEAAALKIWEEALLISKAIAQVGLEEKKSRDDLAKLSKLAILAPPGAPPESTPLAELEALSEKASELLDSTQTKIDELTDQSKKSSRLLAELFVFTARDRAKLEELEIPSPGTGKIDAARYQKALQDKAFLEAKLKQYSATQDFLRREADLFDSRVQRRNQYRTDLFELQDVLTHRISKLKKEEAEATRKELDDFTESISGDPDLDELVDLTNEVRKLNDRRSGIDGPQSGLLKAQEYGDSIKKTRRLIAKQFEDAKRRIRLLKDANLEIDDDTRLLLRKQRSQLPSTDALSSDLRENLERAAQAQLAEIALQDRISATPELTEERIDELVKSHPTLVKSKIQELVTRRSELLRDLSSDYQALYLSLTKGIEAAKTTITEIDQYSDFIDERLLWIKSANPIKPAESLDEWERIVTLFSPNTMASIWSSIKGNLFKKIIPASLLFLSSLAIALRRRRLRKLLKTSSQDASRRNCTSILPTVVNITAAVLLSLWVPLLIILAAILIESPGSWHIGLLRLASLLFMLSVIIKFSRKDGLFVSHFKMHPDRAALIQRSLRWIFPIALPLVFLVSALTNNGSADIIASGRIVFIIALGVGCGFVHHLFHPKRSILQKEGKGAPFTKACYFVIMAIPVVFIVGAALGYFASVLLLRGQVAASAGLLILAFLVVRFLMRWTLVSRRALAIKQALRRREIALAEREHEEEGAEKSPELPSLEEVKAEAVNVVEVEIQSIQLFRLAIYAAVFFGLWGIWSSTLPALKFLDEVTFGDDGARKEERAGKTPLVPNLLPPGEASPDTSETTDAATADGRTTAPEATNAPPDEGVSLQDILLTLAFIAITFIAARNIPSLLSLTLFNRINLGPGGNFALTTTVRYIIVLVGVVVAFGQIGITWGKVQWLAAAVTLGIGFGLQEIFANFVAGIILLFERPIRLGDIVTVGDISGKVTQIRIRATTIQQFNNRELLVPNKEFITSQLINWTLKDSVLRFEIPVGIAYGSDTQKATRILNSILKKHPDVLDEPKPDVLFVSFGNSTLDFNVRGFVASVDHLVSTQSELHYLIDNAFREDGIEIAFPQQDLHLRSLPEGMTLTPKS